MNAKLLHLYFEELQRAGWAPVEQLGDQWRTCYEGVPIAVQIGANWVHAQTPMKPWIDLAHWSASLELLANSQLLLAKLARTVDDRMLLSAEWPTSELNFATLRLLLSSVVRAHHTLIAGGWRFKPPVPTKPSDQRAILYIPEERIWQYLRQIDRYGWSIAGQRQPTRWLFSYRGQSVRFDTVAMQFTDNWTHFQALMPFRSTNWELLSDYLQQVNQQILAPLPADAVPSGWETLCGYLLQLNHQMMMGRFRLAGDGIILAIQCPTEQLNFTLFESCMEAMATYLDRYAPEAIILALSERLGRFVDTGTLPPPDDWGI